MSPDSIAPYLLLGTKWLLALVAAVFVVSGLDDFFIDVYHLVRTIYRKIFVLPNHEPLTEEHLHLPSEQLIAIMIPAWDESVVIGAMLENTLRTVNYSNYQIFVGTYPNDTATQRAVEAVRERYENVQRIVCPKNGPTNKADCLNWIYQGIRLYESNHNVRFEIFVMHDSEDILHPLSLKLFNYLIPRKDMVQLPVFPLEPSWDEFTGGHYLDEFAENHSKDLIVRERLAQVIPSAGVGCAFSRKAFDTVAGGNQNVIFNTDSVTEDYDFGFRLRQYGLKLIFVKHAIERVATRQSAFTGHTREVTVQEYIATREFFPRRVGAAMRQKSRWVVGIAFQGWKNLGWKGDGWMKYMFFRDRKAIVTNQVNLLGYVVLLLLFFFWALPFILTDAYRYPSIIESGSLLWYLIIAATFFLAVRVVARAWYVLQIYGWKQAILSIPRQLWANVINFGAVIRALYIFVRYLITGEEIGWEKTSHQFPSEEQLRGFRRQLGDLLLEKRFITVSQLDDALAQQKETGRPLGAVLLEMGIVEEDGLVQVLGTQLQMSTAEIDPYKTPLELLELVPRQLAVAKTVYPLELKPGGRLVLATNRAVDRAEIAEIESELDRHVEFLLSAKSDLAFAIQRGYARLQNRETVETDGGRLGSLLLSRGYINREQLESALKHQRRSYTRLGDILVSERLMTAEEVRAAIERHQEGDSGRFGDFLVRHGFVTLEQLERVLALQKTRFRKLGNVMVEMGYINEATLQQALEASAS